MSPKVPNARVVDILSIPEFPFLVRMLDGPDNPAGLPNWYPLHLQLDETLGHLHQPSRPELQRLLDFAYRSGSLLGTAMDDTPMGRAYADDFLRFVGSQLPPSARCLEIGAGRGYLTRRLIDAGWNVTALEPGRSNEPHWHHHGVQVISDSFPSPAVTGTFDAILAYAVLEHIADLADFLSAASRQLSTNGRLIVAIPDCCECIAAGDPSILLHEHFHYFTAGSLARSLSANGFTPLGIERAGHGGVLYCSAALAPTSGASAPDASELSEMRNFGTRVTEQRKRVSELLRSAAENGRRIGIYCPNRAIGLLPHHASNIRFFDDDPDQHGKRFPGFPVPIENRSELVDRPVDELWIMSRTFGAKIRDRLRQEPRLRSTEIRLVEDLISRRAA
ncbi:MAG: class I SAM-dependent methyltransferase [Gammaproteobacteria bacterium]|nr:class I SAM-dependent methyltransferase [Gammaproteobacteria bacterium]